MMAATRDEKGRTVERRLWLITLAGVLVLLLLLFFFEPARLRFLPPCPMHALTGLHCPGCGATRALRQLLHGNLAAAFSLNPLFVVALAGLAAYGLACWRAHRRGRPAPAPLRRPAALWSLLALILLFVVLRNIPLPAFEILRP